MSLQEIWKQDKQLLFILLCDVVFSSLLPFPNIIFTGLIVNAITAHDDFSLVILYVAMMFGINYTLTILNTFLGKAKEYRFIKLTNKITNELNDKCMKIDYEQFNDSATLDRIHSVYRTTSGNNYFTNLNIVFSSISKLITLIGIISIMTVLNKWLLFIAVAVIALQSLLHIIRVKKNRKYNLDSMADQRKVSFSSELPYNVEKKKDIIMYDMGEFILKKLRSFQEAMLVYDRRRIRDGGIIEALVFTLTVAFQVTSYVLIGNSAFTGEITIGEFTAGITSLSSFMTATSFLIMNVINYNDSVIYIKRRRSFNKIRSKFDIKSKITIDDIDLTNIVIEFKNVSFRYPNSTNFVLKNINITMKGSEKLAIVGFNGAGKTSFILLLTRMYDPTEGTIFLNGVDIREIDYTDYLKIFATVNQDFALLPFTLWENIARKDVVTPDENAAILQLFRENGMGAKLEKMYRGLDTPITKKLYASGIDFSGGEMQKIAIIRALFKDSPVLILDEPTSALDPVAEHKIYQKFADMSQGKLTVYVSHRIYSTRFCDKIAVLEKGEMKEYGTYDELMEQKGLYYDFFEKQAEYFK